MQEQHHPLVADLAAKLVLGALLESVVDDFGGYDLVDHWQQGEFHHDIVMRIGSISSPLPGEYLVVATNCNGGVKEVLCFESLPAKSALWHARCPDNPEFEGELPPLRARSVTRHWFDPSELLTANARSELRREYRVRQAGGGWMLKK